MKKYLPFLNQYIGTTLSILYALVMRLAAEVGWVTINGWTYLYIIPFIIGIIPFCFKGSVVRKSIFKAITSPLFSVFIFLVICVKLRLEDLICLVIIGAPYIAISIIISLLLYNFLEYRKDDTLNKFYLLLMILPFGTGELEDHINSNTTKHKISNSVDINCPTNFVFKHLKRVPPLDLSIIENNYFNVPLPTHSTYDSILNVRKGYFNNGVILHERVDSVVPNQFVRFSIDIDQSELSNSPTLKHGLSSGLIKFQAITYRLNTTENGNCQLELSASFTLNTKLQNYAQFWSSKIIGRFEENLLISLKSTLEKSYFTSMNEIPKAR